MAPIFKQGARNPTRPACDPGSLRQAHGPVFNPSPALPVLFPRHARSLLLLSLRPLPFPVSLTFSRSSLRSLPQLPASCLPSYSSLSTCNLSSFLKVNAGMALPSVQLLFALRTKSRSCVGQAGCSCDISSLALWGPHTGSLLPTQRLLTYMSALWSVLAPTQMRVFQPPVPRPHFTPVLLAAWFGNVFTYFVCLFLSHPLDLKICRAAQVDAMPTVYPVPFLVLVLDEGMKE